MKRLTAVLTVLCIAVTLFSCAGDGTFVSPSSTAAQNTTESIKTESTTSATEAPGKPEFYHPSIEEINNAIDKTVGAKTVNATLSSVFQVRESTKNTFELTTYEYNIVSEQLIGAPERFSLNETSKHNISLYPEKNIYFDGHDYYLSYLGANVKVPQSGMTEQISPRSLISAALPKLNWGKSIPEFKISQSHTLFTYTLKSSELKGNFASITDGIEKEIHRRTENGFELTLKGASLRVQALPDGSLHTHASALDYTLTIYGKENRIFHITAEVTVSVSGHEEEKSPLPPDGAENYVQLASQSEMPILIFQSIAENRKESGCFLNSSAINISKKELDGSRKEMKLTSQKSVDSENPQSWQNKTRITLNNSNKLFEEIVCVNGIVYVKSEHSKMKYSEEDFNKIFRCNGMSLPDAFGKSDVLAAEIKKEPKLNAALLSFEFALTGEGLQKMFPEQVETAARCTAGGEKISEYELKNCRVSAKISPEGIILEYDIYFDITVNISVNDKKFALTSAVSANMPVSDSLSSQAISIPRDSDTYVNYTPETLD